MRLKTKGFYHKAEANKFREWNERLKLKFQQYQTSLSLLKTFRTASKDTFQDSLITLYAHADFLFQFQFEHGFRRWSFRRYLFQKSAISRCVRTLLEDKGQVAVGIGDFKSPRCYRGG